MISVPVLLVGTWYLVKSTTTATATQVALAEAARVSASRQAFPLRAAPHPLPSFLIPSRSIVGFPFLLSWSVCLLSSTMSGLNPFRPKKPEGLSLPPAIGLSTDGKLMLTVADPTAPHPPTTARPAPVQSVTSVPSYPVFGVPPSSLPPNGVSPSPVAGASDPADSVASDDQSVSDPFHQDSTTDDENTGVDEADIAWAQRNAPNHSLTSSTDDGRRQFSDAAASVASYPTPPTGAKSAMGLHTQSVPARLDDYARYRDDSDMSVSSGTPYPGGRTAQSSSTDLSQTPSAHPAGTSSRPVTGHSTTKPLTSRPGNREKIPPPPPKSHHGKLITPSPGPAPSHTPSIKAANRFSFHGTPSEASISPKPSVSNADYFTGATGSQPERAMESLRRSQSQYKRPPTPPLSRRHSQMRRSKTTHAKPSSSRLSIPNLDGESSESPPPSPGAWSLTPSRTRDAPSTEASLGTPLPTEHTGTTSALPGDTSTPSLTSPPVRSGSTKSTKRMSQGNVMPPPPPPRRMRGSSGQSSDSARRTSMREPKPGDENEPFVPQPSNAHDILADLSRLQKEVDDLRGHYENRRVSP